MRICRGMCSCVGVSADAQRYVQIVVICADV